MYWIGTILFPEGVTEASLDEHAATMLGEHGNVVLQVNRICQLQSERAGIRLAN